MRHSKFTLHTVSNRLAPSMTVELSGYNILCNEDPVLPGDYHPYNMRLWVIGNEHGGIVALWATNEQDALDNAVDLNMLDNMMVSPVDFENISEAEKEDLIYLGNASEPYYQDYLWMSEVSFDMTRDWELLKAFARCGDNDSLDY